MNNDLTIDNNTQSSDLCKSNDLFEQLKAIFLNCKDEYICQCLEQENKNKLINIKNKLIERNYSKIKIFINSHNPLAAIKIRKTFMNLIKIFRYNLEVI